MFMFIFIFIFIFDHLQLFLKLYYSMARFTMDLPITHESKETIEPIKSCSLHLTAESLRSDFSVADLNSIHRHLWVAGRPGNISTLHHQKVLLRNIIPSESSRLHLVWFNRNIYIKPLPECLFDPNYHSDIIRENDHLGGIILGFLRSYCGLIKSPLDLSIAKESHLVSKDVVWQQWAIFRQTVLTKAEDNELNINERYHYGELRLPRLDLIYRFTGRRLNYFTIHRTYGTYFGQYFALLAAALAFVAVILTAMQVLTGINNIPETLQSICYRFSITILVGICVCFGFIFLFFLVIFLYNYGLALVAHA